ncbi:MAG: hypothetical protein BZ137_04290 [Methanosphaera sp. rholeuAM130]|nr:hypothetical protein [Methanosphaera sp.]RAP54049.1 MAG: hypothetical protein BZ137_04290 [Methanosphaera sp. rholeuAM130]
MVDKEAIGNKVSQKKDELGIKREEQILKANEKKTNAKVKIEEKILEKKQARNQRRLESHINLADTKIEEALDKADSEIASLIVQVDTEIANNEDAADLILFKADNILEETLLRTQLNIQVAKNELIKNLQKDIEDALELGVLEENIADLKEKSDIVITTLQGKIDAEKEELTEKYGEN